MAAFKLNLRIHQGATFIRAQIARQSIERDELTTTIDSLSAECAVWEGEHPPAEPDAQA